jgi:hypothetical protein
VLGRAIPVLGFRRAMSGSAWAAECRKRWHGRWHTGHRWPSAVRFVDIVRANSGTPPLVPLASLPLLRLRLAEGDATAAAAVLAEARPLVQHRPFALVAQLLEAAQ